MKSGDLDIIVDRESLDHEIDKNEQPIGNARQTCGLVSRLDLSQIYHPDTRPLKRKTIDCRLRPIPLRL